MNSNFYLQKCKKFFLTLILLVLGNYLQAQTIATYSFTGSVTPSCPNLYNQVTAQPANAVFSAFTNTGGQCVASSSRFEVDHMDGNNRYNQFTVTANPGYGLNLTTVTFSHMEIGMADSWSLRSSLDNYATELGTGVISATGKNVNVNLPIDFINISTVTFRFYLNNPASNNVIFSMDAVILKGSIVVVPADPSNPTSNSPQCPNPGVTLTRETPPAGVTWYWQTSPLNKVTTNSGLTNNVTTTGTYYLRAYDNTTLQWSTGCGSAYVFIYPNVANPVFSAGSTSSRCYGPGTITYNATANYSLGMTYTLDSESLVAGNTINSSTGAVTYHPSWIGISKITANATGCQGSTSSAVHTVTVIGPVSVPVFDMGTSSVRCQSTGASDKKVIYTATASTTTGITYSLDATTAAFNGNSINSGTGEVTYSTSWTGSSTITASAAGCDGPKTATHTVTTTPYVGNPVFAAGSTSTRCQGTGVVNYSATSTNSTGITYSLNNSSISAGNSINSSTGDVTYVAGYSGTTTVTASATGCNGPATSTHTVTVVATVGTPVFTGTATRCQAAGTASYTATASTSTSIVYSLDAASLSAGNSINSSTGLVTYVGSWTGMQRSRLRPMVVMGRLRLLSPQRPHRL